MGVGFIFFIFFFFLNSFRTGRLLQIRTCDTSWISGSYLCAIPVLSIEHSKLGFNLWQLSLLNDLVRDKRYPFAPELYYIP